MDDGRGPFFVFTSGSLGSLGTPQKIDGAGWLQYACCLNNKLHHHHFVQTWVPGFSYMVHQSRRTKCVFCKEVEWCFIFSAAPHQVFFLEILVIIVQKKKKQGPIGSMYGIFNYIYHKNQPNVGEYTSPMDPLGTDLCWQQPRFFLGVLPAERYVVLPGLLQWQEIW